MLKSCYDTFLYAFDDEPPHKILAISKKIDFIKYIDVVDACAVFLSAASLDGDDVILTYGLCDRESRTLRVNISILEKSMVRGKYSLGE